MKYIVSRYNHDSGWLKDYTDDVVMFDRSEKPIDGSIVVPNIGTDIYDKFSYIIDNYDNLPEVAVYTKCNLFKYINREEFDLVKDNNYFTPLLTRNHQPTRQGNVEISFYENGIYWEINNLWYLGSHPVRDETVIKEIMVMMGTWGMSYLPFAPGSNYILTAKDIRRHKREFYVKLRSYLEWTIYPGEGQIIERGLYTLWG